MVPVFTYNVYDIITILTVAIKDPSYFWLLLEAHNTGLGCSKSALKDIITHDVIACETISCSLVCWEWFYKNGQIRQSWEPVYPRLK